MNVIVVFKQDHRFHIWKPNNLILFAASPRNMIMYSIVFNFYTRYVFQLLIRIRLEKSRGIELSLANLNI